MIVVDGIQQYKFKAKGTEIKPRKSCLGGGEGGGFR